MYMFEHNIIYITLHIGQLLHIPSVHCSMLTPLLPYFKINFIIHLFIKPTKMKKEKQHKDVTIIPSINFSVGSTFQKVGVNSKLERIAMNIWGPLGGVWVTLGHGHRDAGSQQGHGHYTFAAGLIHYC